MNRKWHAMDQGPVTFTWGEQIYCSQCIWLLKLWPIKDTGVHSSLILHTLEKRCYSMWLHALLCVISSSLDKDPISQWRGKKTHDLAFICEAKLACSYTVHMDPAWRAVRRSATSWPLVGSIHYKRMSYLCRTTYGWAQMFPIYVVIAADSTCTLEG